MAKGLGAGTFSLIFTFALGKPLPDAGRILMAGALGAVSYGLSIALIILAMRKLGSTRAYGWFGSAPFMAMLLSLQFSGSLLRNFVDRLAFHAGRSLADGD
jgi:hypothetical protein